MQNIIKYCLKCINLFYGITFLLLFIGIIKYSDVLIGAEKSIYAICSGIIIGEIAIWYFVGDKIGKYKLLIAIFILGIQSIYIWAVHSQVDSDAYVINYIAYNYAKKNYVGLEGFWREYLAVYPNNIPATIILRLIYYIWIPETIEQTWFFLSIVAAILADIAIVYIYKLIKTLYGEKMAIFSMIFAIPLILLSESGSILYTDILALWTSPAALYYLIKWCKSDKKECLFITAVILAIGSWIKPQSMVMSISIFMIFIMIHGKKNSECSFFCLIKKCSILIVSYMLILIILLGVKSSAISKIGKEYVQQNKMPVVHFVSMGLNRESLGAYHGADVDAMKAVKDPVLKKELGYRMIVERLSEMKIDGLLKHLEKKIFFAIGRGDFTNSRVWKGVLLNEEEFAKDIQQWTIVGNTKYDKNTVAYIQVCYLCVLFLCVLSAFYSFQVDEQVEEQNYISYSCRVAMIGILLMVCLLECNLRYMYAMIPGMIIVGVGVLSEIVEKKV